MRTSSKFSVWLAPFIFGHRDCFCAANVRIIWGQNNLGTYRRPKTASQNYDTVFRIDANAPVTADNRHTEINGGQLLVVKQSQTAVWVSVTQGNQVSRGFNTGARVLS